MPTKHAFTNPKSDGGDATIARPSDWNAAHVDLYAPGSFTVPDGQFVIMADHLDLDSTESVEIEGTGVLVVM